MVGYYQCAFGVSVGSITGPHIRSWYRVRRSHARRAGLRGVLYDGEKCEFVT